MNRAKNVRGRGGRGQSVPQSVPQRGGRGSYRGAERGGRGAERGGRSMVNKYREAAQMGALLSQNKSFAVQRLLRDYNELKNNNTVILGVSASPLENTMYEWHANIKALTSNIYKGAVLHLSITFNDSYPVKAPIVRVLNTGFTHPSVTSSNEICLDILEDKREGQWRGWTSAYSVQSLLLQLQTFFFDIDEQFLEEREKEKGKINNLVRSLNEYTCTTCGCKHKGSANPWPEFFKVEGDVNQLFKLNAEKYKQTIKGEIVCYHRKTSFEETPLGIGVNVVKAPRTGEIKGLNPIFDFVGIKSYFKEKLRISVNGDRFSHWFPLYFGVKQEQFMHLSKKALSMICFSNTKNFSPELIIKVLPKFFTGLVANIMSEKVSTSCQALKMLIYILRIIHLHVQAYPKVQDEIEAEIFKFKSDPASRVKNITPNLGDLLTYLVLSRTHKIDDLLGVYIEEKSDREIFWILQAIPELEELITKDTIDDVRAKICFKTAIIGNHILLFFYYFIKKIIKKDSQTFDQLNSHLDSNYGNITDEEVELHQREIRKIMKIDNYNEYYKFLNLTPPGDKELNLKLKTAYKNSAAKGYHGEDLVRFVPNQEEQVKILFKNFPSLESITEEKRLLKADNKIWEKLVLENFSFIDRMRVESPELVLTPWAVIKYYEENFRDTMFTSSPANLKSKSKIMESVNCYKFKKESVSEQILKSFTWRQVYVKLHLELYLKHFNNIADFKTLYELLATYGSDLVHLNFEIWGISNLKSDYNYVRATLGTLKNLKQLNFYFMEAFSIKLIKNMIKGINYFMDAHGVLDVLSIYIDKSFSQYSTKDFNVLSIIDKLPTLKVLNFEDSVMDINNALRIRNHLYYYKTIEVLNLKNTKLNDAMAKEIADGIMKAKNLEEINLSNNVLVKGLANVIYNLSFQPSLKILDISSNVSADIKETSEALYKMIKMSQSLEVLIANNIPALIDNLTKDFYYSLGDNASIKYLDLTKCGTLSTTSARLLGQAISFNCCKNGGLQTLLIGNNSMNYAMLIEMVNSLSVSEDIHFQWYGTLLNNNITKDSKEFYEKKFYCRLKHLDISNGNYDTYVNINDLKVKQTNHLRILFENNLNLETLNLSFCKMNKYFLDMVSDALNNVNGIRNLNLGESKLTGDNIKSFGNSFGTAEKPNTNFHIEILNFGKNQFGYSGIECLSNVLKFNNTVKVLNMFHNLFDVNGARRLADALKVNKTLQCIDIGYNRIKDLGLTTITDAILLNPDNKIRHLGVRCNLIKGPCFKINAEKVIL